MINRRLLLKLAAASGLAPGLLSHQARAQTWPLRPIKIIVPFGPGGTSDGMARILAQRLGEKLGQQVIVENRPGASGAIAAEAVARAPADGYTLFWATPSQIAVLPAMAKVTFDPVKDFAPISAVATTPFVLVVNSQSVPVTSLSEFIDYVRKNPGQLTFADGGLGVLPHLVMELFLKRAGLQMTHVTYKGLGQAMTDVIAGHVSAMMAGVPDALPHARGGSIRLLAVSSSERVLQLPDVPTFIQAGFPGFKAVSWNGPLAPAATPKKIIDRIAAEIASTVADPTFVAQLSNYGVNPLGNRPEEFAAMISPDIALWGQAVAIAGLRQQ